MVSPETKESKKKKKRERERETKERGAERVRDMVVSSLRTTTNFIEEISDIILLHQPF